MIRSAASKPRAMHSLHGEKLLSKDPVINLMSLMHHLMFCSFLHSIQDCDLGCLKLVEIKSKKKKINKEAPAPAQQDLQRLGSSGMWVRSWPGPVG